MYLNCSRTPKLCLFQHADGAPEALIRFEQRVDRTQVAILIGLPFLEVYRSSRRSSERTRGRIWEQDRSARRWKLLTDGSLESAVAERGRHLRRFAVPLCLPTAGRAMCLSLHLGRSIACGSVSLRCPAGALQRVAAWALFSAITKR